MNNKYCGLVLRVHYKGVSLTIAEAEGSDCYIRVFRVHTWRSPAPTFSKLVGALAPPSTASELFVIHKLRYNPLYTGVLI